MSTLSAPVARLVAVRQQARDAAWQQTALGVLRAALPAGRFADVLALAEAVGPAARRERDLARFGLGLALAVDAHPDAQRAAKALAGREPALVAKMKASDPRRRGLELTWELKEGKDDLARARAPRRLPSGPDREWWVGVVRLLDEEGADADAACMGAPGELGRWARDSLGTEPPSTAKGRYALALEDDDLCAAARVFRTEFAPGADADGAHAAAMMAICDMHRPDAERHAAAIRDPLTQAIWRVRRALVQPGPGWEAVARAAVGAGWRSVAAPLAWLRAAAAWNELGDRTRSDAALARAGDAGARFGPELALASASSGREYPSVAELLQRFRAEGLAAALTALGQGAPPMLVAELISAAEEVLETSPSRITAELPKLTGPLDLAFCALFGARAMLRLGRSALERVLDLSPGSDASLITAAALSALPNDRDVRALACAAGLRNPFVLTMCATRLDGAGLKHVYEAIERRGEPPGGPSSDELRIALAEGSPLPPTAFPRGLLGGLAGRAGPWSDYAFMLQTGVGRPPRHPPDPRIEPALREDRPVFSVTEAATTAFTRRMGAVGAALEAVYSALEMRNFAPMARPFGEGFTLGDYEEARPRQAPTAAENQAKKAHRKAQKAARKASRKRK